MAELEDDPRCDRAFASYPDTLAKLAASAMTEYPQGKTQELAPETLSIRLIQPTSVTGSKVTKKGKCMQTILWSREEVPPRAKHLYESSARPKIDLEENVGKIVIMDLETADYKVDENGLHAADYLSAKHPNARLLGICIGYQLAASLSSVIEPHYK
ncbi:hypothetical protein QUB47_07110 [Microcoleus sp. AT9_B5]